MVVLVNHRGKCHEYYYNHSTEIISVTTTILVMIFIITGFAAGLSCRGSWIAIIVPAID